MNLQFPSITLFPLGLSSEPVPLTWYWVASNLFSIIQMYILNAVINPKKYVDYDALERSRKALADIKLQVADLALAAAEKATSRSLTAEEDVRLIREALAEVELMRPNSN